MTPRTKLLIENGWYRVAGSWWHTEIGREPKFGGAVPQRKALKSLRNPENLRGQYGKS